MKLAQNLLCFIYTNSGACARNRKIKLEISNRSNVSRYSMSENNGNKYIQFDFFHEIQFFVEMNPMLRTKIDVLLFE